MMKESEEPQTVTRHSVLYRAELSGLYHRKRERFFALCDRLSKATALVAGSAAFSSFFMFNEADWKSYAGVVVAISTTLSLVFAWSDKARQHADLAQKYVLMQSEIIEVAEDKPDVDLICSWGAKVRRIEAEEPPTLAGLVRLCQNQLAKAAGQKDMEFPLPWYQRWLVHFLDMSGWLKNRKDDTAN